MPASAARPRVTPGLTAVEAKRRPAPCPAFAEEARGQKSHAFHSAAAAAAVAAAAAAVASYVLPSHYNSVSDIATMR